MPYIEIKAYPKDTEIKKRVAERINAVFLEEWGCSPEALSISFEEVAPDDWNEKVEKAQVEPNADKMMILHGEKRY